MNYARKVVGNTTLVMGLKIVGVVSMLSVNALLARLIDQEDLGMYFLIISIVMFFSILAKMGQRQAVVRLVSEAIAKKSGNDIPSIYISAVIVSVIGSFVVSILWVLGVDKLIALIVKSAELMQYSIKLLLMIILYALLTPVVETLRGMHEVGKATIYENVFSQVLLAVVLCMLFFFKVPVSLEKVIDLTILSILISLVISSLMMFKYLKVYIFRNMPTVITILYISLPLLLVNIANFLLNNSGIWFSVVFLDREAVALYGAAWKFIQVLIFPLAIVNISIQPIIVELYATKQLDRLERILRGTATLLAAPTFVIVMFMIVLRDELMTFIYGSNYVESSDVFLILIIGQLINILTGQNTVLLSLTGHQKLLMRVALLCVFVSFTVSYMLVRQLGIEGIALGVSLGLFLSNTISLYLVHRKIGITIFASMDLKFLKAAADSVLISKTK